MSGIGCDAKIEFIFILVHAFTKHYSHLGCQRKEKNSKTQNPYIYLFVMLRSITYKKSYFTLSYNRNSAQFQFEYEQGIEKEK